MEQKDKSFFALVSLNETDNIYQNITVVFNWQLNNPEDHETVVFDTGDPIIDWIDMLNELDKKEVGSIKEAFSVDYFVFNHDEYTFRSVRGREFLVHKDMHTYSEIKEYYSAHSA